jgi:uncharacterized membrane protein YcaP (DUF421 family)
MGKRQIGQLDISDLITTLLISEIASLPIENPDIPIVYSIIPIVTLLTFEVTSSSLLSKSQFMKNIFSTRPSFLVKDGKIDQKALAKNRISIDELISKLRQQSINDIAEIKYAILEQDGQVSIVPYAPYRQPNLSDMHIKVKENGIMHVIIANGSLNSHGLDVIKKDKNWVEKQIAKRGVEIKDVFLMTVNDAGEIQITKKE